LLRAFTELVRRPALQQFTQANDGLAPQSVAQLATFIDPPIDAAILERYEILNTGTNVAGDGVEDGSFRRKRPWIQNTTNVG